MADPKLRSLTSLEESLAVMGGGPLFLYKHSTRCGVSTSARLEVLDYVDGAGALPVFVIDVIRDRALSKELAARTGVRHESPQAILVKDGRVLWNDSHEGITKDALEEVARRLGK